MTPSTAATPWTEVVATALIGTDRRPTGGQNPAAEVLDLAAALTPFRRAGVRPATVDPATVDQATVDATPLVPHAAGIRLELLLEGGGPVPWQSAARELILVEWLGLAAASGQRVTPHLLPALLEVGRMRSELRPLIASTGGVRARWLAEQNPDWRYLSRSPDESIVDVAGSTAAWETGTGPQRLGYLRGLRRTDPAAARELLERDWPTLTPDERGDLVAALMPGLDQADEPLLERALDDRRMQVREAAAGLLVRLPGSAYQDRMAVRARACVAIAAAGDLLVTPPAECDTTMRRDGIAPKPPTGSGARAWWLEEVLARTPLSTWPVPADEFLARGVPDDWANTVHRGLARAAATHQDGEWAGAALDALSETPRDRAVAATLYPILDGEQLARRTIAALTEGSTARWGPLLFACPPPWPDELAQAAMSGMAALIPRAELAGDLYQLCRLAAIRLPVRFAPMAQELAERARAATPEQRSIAGLDSMAAVLAFRAEMTAEFTQEAQ